MRVIKSGVRNATPEQIALSKEIIDFYETHHRSKPVTLKYFLEKEKNLSSRDIYHLLRLYHNRKGRLFRKERKDKIRRPRPPKACTAEKQQQLLELMTQDPTTSMREAASVLNVGTESIRRMKRALMAGNLLPEAGKAKEIVKNDKVVQEVATATLNSDSKINVVDWNSERGPLRCLLCFECLNNAEYSEKFPAAFNFEGNQIAESLNVLFLLKNVLDFKTEDIMNYMHVSEGRDPGQWVKICGNCRDQVQEAMKIRRQILKLERKFQWLKGTVLEKISESSFLKARKREASGLEVTKEVRREIIGKGKVLQMPEILLSAEAIEQGDREAQALAKRYEVVVKVEPDFEINEDYEDASFNTDTKFIPPDEQSEPKEPESFVPSLAPVDFSKIPLTLTVCDLCGEKIRPVGLPLHKLRVHGVTMEGHSAFKCTEEGCLYITTYKAHYKMHLNKAHGPSAKTRPFPCQYCGKRFPNTNALRDHENIHRNAINKPFQCDLCGSSFAVASYLRIHLTRTHKISTSLQNVRWIRKKKLKQQTHLPAPTSTKGTDVPIPVPVAVAMENNSDTSVNIPVLTNPVIITTDPANRFDLDHSSISDIPIIQNDSV